MCLIALALAPDPDLALVVLANRDESYARPTEPLHAWSDGSGIVAGRDLERGGTWMGVRVREGAAPRFAALTNVRDPADLRPKEPGERSRGDVVRSYLESDQGARAFLESASADRAMRGFNLLALDETGLYWGSNRAATPPSRIPPGVHGLSNAFLDTPWPKVVRARDALSAALARHETGSVERLFALLDDERGAADAELPDTGVGLTLERALAPIRIALPTYGTRCSTVLVARTDGTAILAERTLAPITGEEVRVTLTQFQIPPAALALHSGA